MNARSKKSEAEVDLGFALMTGIFVFSTTADKIGDLQ